jgi:hypothetical protein
VRGVSSCISCCPERGELRRGLLSLRLGREGVDPLNLRGFSGCRLNVSAVSLPGADAIRPSLLPAKLDSEL